MGEIRARIVKRYQGPGKEVQRQRPGTDRVAPEAIDLNLRSLDAFVQIAENGGMSSTARRMGLTQSAVSQMIANLELSLGVQLFDRQVRPLALTPRGSVLLEKARALLLAARETVQATRSPAAPTFSKVSLWLIDSLAATIGSELFRNIRDLAGAWYVQQGSHAVHAQALLSRAADVILTSDPMEDEPHLERHKIIKEPFVLALPERLAHCRDKLSELAATCDFVRFGSRTLISRQIDRYLRRRRIDVRGQIEFDSCEAVLAAVAAGYGWAIVTPLAALAGKSHWPRVDFAPLPEPIGHRRIFVVARQGELGPLPQVIAEVAAQCIATRFEEDFVGERLWMAEGCALKFRDGI